MEPLFFLLEVERNKLHIWSNNSGVKDTGDRWKMRSLKENDLHTDRSAKMGDAFTVLWPCPIVCVHTGFIQAEHINCVIWKALILGWSSWTSWANLTPSSPIIKLITVAASCATYFINQWLVLRRAKNKGSLNGPKKWERKPRVL